MIEAIKVIASIDQNGIVLRLEDGTVLATRGVPGDDPRKWISKIPGVVVRDFKRSGKHMMEIEWDGSSGHTH
jgi:hypothetical protein